MRKLTILLIGFLLLMASQLTAQPFESITSSFPNVGRSYMAWGDYDHDGDLDAAICGITAAGDHISKIYINDEGTFTDIEAGIKGVKDGSLEWGDYDNDEDLDLLITGETFDAGSISLIYTNNEGSFELYDAGFAQVAYGHGAWGDYDNDGDLDVLITGEWNVNLYVNEDGVFTLLELDFGQLQTSRAAWGDFDNDGDLDLLLIGDTGGGPLTAVYINEKGSFSMASLEMEGLFSGTTDWVDFDNDGDLDICVSGYDIFLEPRFIIYENLGDESIALYETYLPGMGISTVDWGDYDNDGDLDILASGKNASCGGGISYIYYSHDGYFDSEPQANIDGAIRCNAGWADFDNDGDLDFLLTGMTPTETPFSKLYRNQAGDNNFVVNTAPSAPANLESSADGGYAVLSWDKANDDQTPQNGLNYNLRVGTTPGGNEVLSAMADEESGFRYIQALGNTNTEISRMIMKLEEGTYYWSVQAIDQAFSGSLFAEEESFTIIETGIDDVIESKASSVYPNPAKDKIYLQSSASGNIEYRIFNANGQELMQGRAEAGNSLDISSLVEGIYFIHFQAGDEASIQRFIKQ